MYITDGEASASTLSNVTKIYAASANVSQVMSSGGLTSILGPSAFDTTDEGIIRIVTFPYAPFGVISYTGVLPQVPDHWSLVDVTENISQGGGHGTPGFKVTGKVLCMDISYGNNLNDIWETFIGSSTLPYVNQTVNAANTPFIEPTAGTQHSGATSTPINALIKREDSSLSSFSPSRVG